MIQNKQIPQFKVWCKSWIDNQHGLMIDNQNNVYRIWQATSQSPYELVKLENAIICRFTGLFDKNGTELYLNDRLNIEGVGIVKVAFKLGAFGYIFPESNNFVPLAMELADGNFNINDNCIQEIELIKEAGND